MVLVKIGIVLLFIITGSFFVKPGNWHPFMPFGIKGVITGASAVFLRFSDLTRFPLRLKKSKNRSATCRSVLSVHW